MPLDPPRTIDLLVTGASGVATCAPDGAPPREPARGRELAEVAFRKGAGVAIDGGRVVKIDRDAALEAAFRARERIDARGGVVIPGLVDAHTHPVFAAGREDEFERKTRGESYAQIAAAGGGIVSSMRALREAADAELDRQVRVRFERFLACGTTAVEAKSGYGLSKRDELRSLRSIARVAREVPLTVVPTLLAAHAVPPEHRASRERYLEEIREELVPEVVADGLARFHDVFVEAGFFSADEARTLLTDPRSARLRPKLHVDELSDQGGAALAVELGAVSADHLDHVSKSGIERIAASQTVAVVLPGVSHFLRARTDAPARALIEAGAAVALATDYNPGTCPTPSLFEAMHLAAIRMRLSAAEALVAATRNAAFALGMGGEVGFLAAGGPADLVVCDVPDVRDFVYTFGRPPVAWVVVGGRIVRRPPSVQGVAV